MKARIEVDRMHLPPGLVTDGQRVVKLCQALDAACRRVTGADRRHAEFFAELCVYVAGSSTRSAVTVNLGRPWDPRLLVQAYCREYGWTPREAEVMTRILLGHRPKDIAASLAVEMATIRTQVGKALKKSGYTRTDDLLLAALCQPTMTSRLG